MSGPPLLSLITVVGGDVTARQSCADELQRAGLPVVIADSVAPPEPDERGEGRDGVVLVIGGGTARRDGSGALLDTVAEVRNARSRALVVCCVPRAEADVLEQVLSSGADDVVFLPAAPGELVARVRAAGKHAAAHASALEAARHGNALLAAGAMIRDGVDLEESLSDWLQQVCEAADLERGILLLCTDDDSSALLVGASDDPGINRVPIDLDRYPEVKACIESRKEVLVEEARSSALLGPWAELAAQHGGEALIALPLVDRDNAIGALLLRSHHARPALPPRTLEFLRSAAALLALLLRASGALAAVREQTRRRSLAHHENERRTHALNRYSDLLDSAAEATVVVDSDGTVLYLNRAAEQLTGYRRDGLEGKSFAGLVAEVQRDGLAQTIRAAAIGDGAEPTWCDLLLQTTSGERLLVSASTSSALVDVGAAVITFRDVTLPRALEAELQKTNQFLERLIDSTVDAIVASDLRGRVILFNKGAVRLTGWEAEEVIGKIPVWKLYPAGQAQAIMHALRSNTMPQRGRLEPSRLEVLGRDGTRIPVSLTASLVYEDQREVATVGVVSDLREQLRIEHRLAEAQERLIVSERQAAVAELAGTAAHELNQPLTSVMGYSELLKRRMTESDPHFRAVDTILREAERMAEIVRKIGRITKYETKNYVGSTQIIDLEKSTNG